MLFRSLLAPYENLIVTAELTREQLIIIAQETGTTKNARNIMGLKIVYDGDTVTDITTESGQPLDPAKRYKLALNSYDSQSGGQRILKLRAIMQEAETNATFHPEETRDAITEFFLAKTEVSSADLTFA